MKTASQHFENLPVEIREKAIVNMGDNNPERDTLSNALSASFLWDESPEGYKYWDKIYLAELLKENKA